MIVKRSILQIAAFLLLAIAVQIQAFMFRQNKSSTVDETFYLACAINTQDGRSLDPALVNFGVAPLPVLINWLPAVSGQQLGFRGNRWQGLEPDQLFLRRARLLNSLLVGTSLVAIVYFWLLYRRGLLAAVLGGVMMAFSPSLLAHSSLATTDAVAALGWLLCLVAFVWFAKSPSLRRAAGAGTVAGVALSAKYSAGIVFVVFVILCVTVTVHQYSRKTITATRRGAVCDLLVWIGTFGYVALVICWGLHGFAVGCLADRTVYPLENSPWIASLATTELPTPLVGMLVQQLHNDQEHAAVLFGEVNMNGWWYYFPVVAIMKATPSELFVVVMSLFAAAARTGLVRLSRQPKGGARTFLVPNATRASTESRSAESCVLAKPGARKLSVPLHSCFVSAPTSSDWSRTTWWIALALGAAFLFLVRIQIGHRYVLPLLPIVLLLAVDSIAQLSGGIDRPLVRRLFASGIVFLLAGQITFAMSSAPHYLAYISPLFGGSSNGYRLVADSNVDWGQDLPSLRKTLEALPSDRVVLSYFGTASPQAYNIHLPRLPHNATESLVSYDFLAISISHLYGIHATSNVTSRRFRTLLDEKPAARAGHSILIYDLRGQARRGL